jgi:hypothetical protein
MKSWERIGAITGFEVDQWCEEGCMLDAALLAWISHQNL